MTGRVQQGQLDMSGIQIDVLFCRADVELDFGRKVRSGQPQVHDVVKYTVPFITYMVHLSTVSWYAI